MRIHPDWLFVSVMKCATVTLYRALPGHRYGKGFHPRPAERVRPLQWCVIRNPYDRAVSIWAATCLRDEGDRYRARHRVKRCGGDPRRFADFVMYCLASSDKQWARSHHWLYRPQSEWLEGVDIDRVARFDHLGEDVPAIIREPLVLPKLNASDRDDWRSYYESDPETERLVREWAGQDWEWVE